MSVNFDPIAIEKIREKGLKAILCRAEELHLQKDGIITDIFLSYEMLEHLFNLIEFLHTMALKSRCEYFVVTVPYVSSSRIGLHQLRNNSKNAIFAENTHIFELSPAEWKLIFQFSGWKVVYEKIYKQYPKSFPLYFTKFIWRKFDFEGFYGVILEKNLD